MSSNDTSTAADDVVLSGGLIFVIVFFATGLFFLIIMSVVCFGEYKEYRNRSRRADDVYGGNYPKQEPPVTNQGNPNGNHPQQSGAGNSGQNSQHPSQVAASSVVSGAQSAESVSLSTKRKQLPPLKLDTKITNPEDIFSPRTNLPPKTTVAFVDAPLPSISSKVKQNDHDLTPIISIST